MNHLKIYFIAITLFSFCLQGCQAQPAAQSKTLELISSIDLPGVSGRIDHLAFDPISQHIFLAALGNNSVEVVDLKNNKPIYSIQNLREPQGIAYIPVSNTMFVANGNNGKCEVFDAKNFQKITSIQLQGDADNVRYDSVNRKVYVGYGDGGIAIIDANSFKQVGDIKLEGHPESFQLDIAAGKIYVNVPDRQRVEIIAPNQQIATTRLKLTAAKSNFPMALDAVNHRLFIGCRQPAKLLVLDTDNGNLIAAIDTDSDVDDIFYNKKTADIYLSCGGGYIDIIRQQNAQTYSFVEKIRSHTGARTSLFIPRLNRLVVASPKSFSNKAVLLVYGVKN